MARSPLAKLCRIAGFVWVLVLLFAIPAGAGFLSFVEVQRAGFGEVGSTVTDTVWLDSPSGATDSLDISVSESLWPTSLSMSNTGAISPVESVSLTAEVEISALTSAWEIDTATTPAASASDPALTESAAGTTEAIVGRVALVLGFTEGVNPDRDSEVSQIKQYLLEMGLLATDFYPTTEGFRYSDIQDFDLVIFDDGGTSWGSRHRQEIIDVLTQAHLSGTSLYLLGDDLSYRADVVVGVSELTHLQNATSNGSSGTVTFVGPSHPVVDGPFGTVAGFTYSRDIDETSQTNTGEVLVAEKAGSRTPVVVAFENTRGARIVTQAANVHSTGEGTVSDEAGLGELEKLFKNTVDWLMLPTRTVDLVPPSQSGFAAPSETVTYTAWLSNGLGADDSFTLALGGYAWETTLSTDSLGPIANGDSMDFTVSVTVPADAEWYRTDKVVVTAASVTRPTVYSDTATFTTQAYAPSEISVSPDALASTQYVDEIVAKTLNISNGNGVSLTFGLAEQGATPVQEGLVADYPFKGNAGDESDNGNHGTVHGATLTEDRFGYPDSAYSFDGLDDYIAMQSPLTLSEFTFSLWIKTEKIGGRINNDRLYTIDDGTGHHYALQGNSGGALSIVVDGPEVNEFDWAFEPGVWTYIVVTFDGLNSQLFKDGVRTETGAIPGLPITGMLTISDPQRWQGGIDDIRIYNRVLSKAEIQELYGWQGDSDVSWLSKDPISGTVPTNRSTPVQVTFDATGMQPGDYPAGIIVRSNDPFTPTVSVPVSMTVLPTASMGWVEGTVTDARTGEPLEATVVALGQPYTINTDPATGSYTLWLDADRYTVRAAAEGYVAETATVEVVAQQGATQGFVLVRNVPVLEVSSESLEVTHRVGEVSTREMTIGNDGPAPLDFEISSGSGVSPFAVSTELYGYDVPDAWLRVVGTQDDTHVRVVDLDTGAVIDEHADLDRYEIWDVHPSDGTAYKVEANQPVVGYESDMGWGNTAFVASLDSGAVGREFIFYYHRDTNLFYVFAVEEASVEVYDSSGNLVDSQTLPAGGYWELSLPDAVYHVVSTGRIAIETVAGNGYTTVPSSEGDGIGQHFYFATDGYGAFAVFAYDDADVKVYDLDSNTLLYSQHIDRGDHWWQTGVGSRRLRLESTGRVEVWAGDTEGGTRIELLGDDISFGGGDEGREYYMHSLKNGSVIFAPFDHTEVDVDGTIYHLDRDEYVHLGGCCDFRHIQSTRPVLIQTLGRDGGWNDAGTYLGGLVAGNGAVSWLGTGPLSGTVSAHSSTSVQVIFDATGMQPGDYATQVVVRSNDPFTPSVAIPGTITVLPTADMGWIEGTVTDADSGSALRATVVAQGQPYKVATDPDSGTYKLWLDAGSYNVQVAEAGYVSETVVVDIVAQQGITQDFSLVADVAWRDVPCDVELFVAAIKRANANGKPDTLNLAPGCTYHLAYVSSYRDGLTGLPLITSSITVNGNGAILDGQEEVRVLYVAESGSLALNNVTIGRGRVYGDGEYIPEGGFFDCQIYQNGGGILNRGALELADSLVTENGGLCADGSGIYNAGGATMTLTNITVSGNGFDVEQGLAGISNAGTAELINSTVTDNGLCNSRTMTLRNTIVAGHCSGDPVVSEGTNMDSDGSCGLDAPGDLPNIDPLLGPLQDNGGPTQTHELLKGSPAIDAGDDAACPATDQRGIPRPKDGDGDGTARCDIGAYERQRPTSIDLISFTAQAGADRVTLAWETGSEEDNAGFNLWRSEAETGPYQKLNPTLIPAQGGPGFGVSYTYTDDTVVPGVTYWYKLQDVDTYDTSSMHGPVSATLEQIHPLYLPYVPK